MKNTGYELEAFYESKKAIHDLVDNLDKSCNELDVALEELRQAWQTKAGEKFFEEHEQEWTTYVKKYTRKLRGIEKMLQCAINHYEQMDNEVKNLNV